MPTINFEYTDNLAIDEKVKSFLLEIHHILVKEIKTDLKTCRSTITRNTHYLFGDNHPKNAFLVLRIQMLPGRTKEIKDRTGKILLKKIYHDFSEVIQEHDTQVRVYLTEIDKQHYYGLEGTKK